MAEKPSVPTSAAAVPGVPAAKANPVSVAGGAPAATGANAPAPVALPAGNVDATKASVTSSGGNRGGRPRKDGLAPGSPEALARDREKDAEYQRNKRAAKSAARVAALPTNESTPEPAGEVAPVESKKIPVSFPAVPAAQLGWLAADLQPLAKTGIPLLEKWRQERRRKILAPLKLDAAAQSEILSSTQWPELAKNSLIQGAPESLATVANWMNVPLALKPHLLSLPSLAFLIQHELEADARLEKLVREHLAKNPPAEPEKKP